MLKGIISRDNCKLINDHITFYGQVIRKGLEFKLYPLKIHKDDYKETNTISRDPFVNYIKILLKENKFDVENLQIKSLKTDTWEVIISD